MRRRSAFVRLTLVLGLAFFVATAAVLAAVYFVVSADLDGRMRTLVASDLTGLADLYAQRRLPALREAIETRLARDPTTAAVYLLLDKAGGRLVGNIDAWPADLVADGEWSTFAATPSGGGADRFLGAGAVLPGGFKLAVGHSTADNRVVLDRLLAMFTATGLAFLVIGGLGAAVLSRWLVRRVVAVNRVAAEVKEGNLAARVAGAEAPDEFGELAGNVNAMLDRIERLVVGMREVSDRIAHELRTPLTRLRRQVGRLDAAPPGSPEAAEARAAIGDEVAATVAIFDALLDIATTEAEAGDTSRLKTVDLVATATTVVELYDAVAEERGITLKAELPEKAEMLGDGGLLLRMIANVVDNAIKFSPPAGTVTIRLAAGAASHVLTVADEGSGLGADIRDRAFDRFSRGNATASVPGHGLGLSIVRAIAVRHGIKVALEDARPGLAVVFTCPALAG